MHEVQLENILRIPMLAVSKTSIRFSAVWSLETFPDWGFWMFSFEFRVRV